MSDGRSSFGRRAFLGSGFAALGGDGRGRRSSRCVRADWRLGARHAVDGTSWFVRGGSARSSASGVPHRQRPQRRRGDRPGRLPIRLDAARQRAVGCDRRRTGSPCAAPTRATRPGFGTAGPCFRAAGVRAVRGPHPRRRRRLRVDRPGAGRCRTVGSGLGAMAFSHGVADGGLEGAVAQAGGGVGTA